MKESTDKAKDKKASENSNILSEEWQKSVQSILKDLTNEQIDYVQSCLSKCRSENHEKEFSTKDMPKD